jgi:hypothetical protein
MSGMRQCPRQLHSSQAGAVSFGDWCANRWYPIRRSLLLHAPCFNRVVRRCVRVADQPRPDFRIYLCSVSGRRPSLVVEAKVLNTGQSQCDIADRRLWSVWRSFIS